MERRQLKSTNKRCKALQPFSVLYIYIYIAEGPGFKSWRVSYFLFVPLRSFFLCYPGEALEGPISTVVSNKLNNIDSNNGILISKKYYTK